MTSTKIANDPFGRDKTVADLLREQERDDPRDLRAGNPGEGRHMMALVGLAAPRIDPGSDPNPAFEDRAELAVVKELACGLIGRRNHHGATTVDRSDRTVEDMLRAADTPLTVESVERSIRAAVPHVDAAVARRIAARVVEDHGGG